MLLYTNADMIMLGYYYNDEAVGIYAIAVRVYNIVNMVISSVIGVATPGLSYDYDKRDYESFNDKLTYVVNYIIFLFLPAFVGLNMMAPEIIRLVSGKDLLLAATALHILTISMLFSLISATLGLAILFPMGYDRINFNSCIISAVTNIILNLYFIPKFGIAGAAITTAIAEFVGFLNKIKYIDKNIKVIGFFKMLIKYAVGSLLVLIICIAFKHIIQVSNIRIIVTMGTCGIVYALYLLVIKDEFFINFIKPIIKKLGICN
jgi:O-antigen/teichoic acid export membrane protein